MHNEKIVFGNVQIEKIEREKLYKVKVALDNVQIKRKCEDKHNVKFVFDDVQFVKKDRGKIHNAETVFDKSRL